MAGIRADEYAQHRNVKPATKEVWSQVVRNLKEHFGEGRAVDTITEGDADRFKEYLIGQKKKSGDAGGLAHTTVYKRLQFARMFFRAAVRNRLIASNPFAEVHGQEVLQTNRKRFLTLEETQRILDVCTPIWKTIVALCRFGGLRCPSEVLSLK